jgi:hypothetical protein
MTKTTKKEIEKAISEIVKYAIENDIDPSEFNKKPGRLKSFNQFRFDKKVNDVLDKLSMGDYKEYFVETIVFEKTPPKTVLTSQLLLEYQQYKNIPKTNLFYRYDNANTNTKTMDHIHVFAKDNQLYAIITGDIK